MSKELVISSNRHETKVGVLEDDQLVEVFFQRANEYSLAGSIHKGRVTRVLPGMQSAFVDLGLERDTFLYVSDFFEEHPEEFDPVTDSAPQVRPPRESAPREAGSTEREAAGPAENRGGDRRDNRSDNRGDSNDRRYRGRDRGGRDRERGPRQDRPRFDQQRPVEAAPSSAAPAAAESLGAEEGPAIDAFLAADQAAAQLIEGRIAPLVTPPAAFEPTGAPPEVRPFGERSNVDRPNVDRSGGDRDRGGDRRRRSRRRRTRGQGFPDNKYAQPGAASAPAVSAASSHSPKPELVTEEEETAPREIILLPGESLAKYRNAPVAASVAAAVPVPKPPDLEEVDLEEVELEEDDLEGEAEGFFAGTTEEVTEVESSEEEHEALTPSEGVGIHPEPEVLTASIEPVSHRQPLVIETASATAPEPETLPAIHSIVSHVREEREHEEHLAAQLAEELRGDKVEPEIADDEDLDVPSYLEEELADTDAIFPESLDLPEAGVPGIGEFDDDEPIELEAAISESIEPAEPLAPGSVPPAQQAFVREQGNHAPHRVGRRMRRRRGGRGGQYSNEGGAPQPQQGSPNAAPVVPAEGRIAEARTETRLEGQFRSEAKPEARVEPREQREQRGPREDRPRPESIVPSITDLLKPGQEIIVQIAKEPLGQKGARITSHIALPGRYVVFMPSVDHLGVSRKIASDEERLRLKRILQAHRVGTSGGFICRTAGEGRTEDEIAADMSFLYNLWLDIRQKAEKKPAPALLHHDLDVVQRILRDQLTDEYKAIWVDNEDLYESALRFVQRFQPALVGRVKMYTRTAPIFDAFGITQELEKALRPKVWLKSGGYIVINQTEALVAIDVNTGKYVGKSNRLEDTIVKTNTEAVKEIVRQVRLRDLGGIIVVDFIDMDERKNRQKVMGALEDAMRADKAPYKILQFNDFGLVAITRKRVKQSLERTLCAPCPYCEGAGYVKSVQTIIGEILIEAQKIARAVEGKDVMLRVHPDVAKVLKSNNNQYLEELEEILGRPVLVAGDAALHHEKFDLA